MQDQNTPMEQDAMMDGADLYTLVDEEGNEKLFELVDILEENGQVYFALIPHIEDPAELLEGEVELVVLNAKTTEDGSEVLEPIESDEEYDRIAENTFRRYPRLQRGTNRHSAFGQSEKCGRFTVS